MQHHEQPLPPLEPMTKSLGKEFNLILLVRENFPQRMLQIEKEVISLENKVVELTREKRILGRMLSALEQTEDGILL